MSSLVRVVVGSVLGAGGLWLALRDLPLSELGEALLAADLLWAGAALAATLIALAAVVARWRGLLGPDSIPLPVLFRATVVGQMLNILLPLRLGEAARIYTAASHGGLGLGRVAASVAIEKTLDLALFGVAAAALVLTALVPAEVLGVGRSAVLPAIALAALIVVIGAGYWKVGLSAVLWSVAIFGLAAAANQLLLVAFGLALPLSAGIALLVVLQAGSVPPALPGRLGIYNYLTVLTLGLYGIDRQSAATYSIALYVVAFVPKLLLGALVATDPAWRPSGSWTARG